MQMYMYSKLPLRRFEFLLKDKQKHERLSGLKGQFMHHQTMYFSVMVTFEENVLLHAPK